MTTKMCLVDRVLAQTEKNSELFQVAAFEQFLFYWIKNFEAGIYLNNLLSLQL